MIVFRLGYQHFAVPDEFGDSVLRMLPHVQPVETDGYGADRTYSISDETLELFVEKVPQSKWTDAPPRRTAQPPAPKTEDDEVVF